MPSSKQFWQQIFKRQDSCPTLETVERLMQSEKPDAELMAHVNSCPSCQSELDQLRSFNQIEGTPAEQKDLDWVVRQTRQRVGDALRQSGHRDTTASVGRRQIAMTGLALAAVLVLIFGLRSFVEQDLGVVNLPPGGITRSLSIQIERPVGDLEAAPGELVWKAVPGASRYQVRILEIDGTEYFSGDTEDSSMVLDGQVQGRLQPGKPFHWIVTAFNEEGQELASSRREPFRVLP